MKNTKCSRCSKVNNYKKKYEKYKSKYKIAKAGLSDDERELIIELICNEQIKHMIVNNQYESDKYNALEQLKAKIRVV